MVTRYLLQRPVIGSIESAKQIVTIPAGATVTARNAATPVPGLCTVVWDEKVIEAYRMDLDQHGIVLTDTAVGSKHPKP